MFNCYSCSKTNNGGNFRIFSTEHLRSLGNFRNEFSSSNHFIQYIHTFGNNFETVHEDRKYHEIKMIKRMLTTMILFLSTFFIIYCI